MLLWGGIRVVDGAILIGTLLAAVLYVRNFFSPMQEVAFFLNSYQSATAALEKVSGVLEEEPTVPDPVEAGRPVGGARAPARSTTSTFGYSERPRRSCPTSRSTSRRVQTIALVGTTGAGKSTLAKLVSRFYDPTTRPVTLDGVDLRSLHPKDLRRAIVMVTQEAYLFSGTVADNIALGKPDATLDEIQRRGARGGGGRLHRAPARRLRHRRQQARRPRVGGSAPADLVRAGVPREPGGADPRRGDGVARHPERAA